jgi:hypothetical protein
VALTHLVDTSVISLLGLDAVRAIVNPIAEVGPSSALDARAQTSAGASCLLRERR